MERVFTPTEQKFMDGTENELSARQLADRELSTNTEPGEVIEEGFHQPIPLTAEHRQRDEEILAEVKSRGPRGGRGLLALLQEQASSGCGTGSCGN